VLFARFVSPLSVVSIVRRVTRQPVSKAAALQREDTRLEASEMLRGLIDSIVLIPDEGQLRIELKGNLAGMLTADQQMRRSPETGDFSCRFNWLPGQDLNPRATNSTSRIYPDNGWVTVEVEVLGAERVRHIIDGQTVLEYEKPMIGGGVATGYDPAIKKDGTILEDGYMALQAESQPVEFRNVRLLNLSGCMDPASPSYRAYYVHRDDSRCAR
jgi:hypothetical protein